MDKKRLLKLGQGLKTAYPRNKSVIAVFEEIVKKYPGHSALRFAEHTMSYAELNRKSNQLARHLQKMGVKKQDFVGIYLERSIDLFVGVLGILKAGAIYVPIDAAYPMERKLYMIEDTGLKILITTRSSSSQFPQEKLRLLFLNELKFSSPETNLNLPIGPLDLAYVNYTSGTTGNPKGVPIFHRGINRLVVKPNWISFSPDDRFLQISNISFDALTHELWGALLNGATLCIYPQINLLPDELGKFIAEEKVTQIIFTARLFNLMVEEALESLKNVRSICSVGDVMSAKHAKIAFEKLPSCRVINACGHTENTTHTTAYTISNTKEIKHEVPIGRPIGNTTVYILDEEQRLAAFGTSGELCTGGDGLAQGYLNRPKLTAEKFIPNPFGKGLLYRTGDLVRYLPDGNISFLGRIDTQVKIRGFRIELGEIEEATRAHPHVSDCVAIVREEMPGDKQLIVYVEPKQKKTVTSEELSQWISSHLPSYMAPSFFVILKRLPMTPNGKIDRKALPAPTASETKKGFFKTETEKAIGAIWAQILHRKTIDRHDHFFKIGGDSIHAMQVISRLKKAFGREISTAGLFEHPILADLGREIDALKQLSLEPIHRRKKLIPLPLSLNQESLWLSSQLTPLKLLYMVHYTYHVEGKISPSKLREALKKIINRHEILRTHFVEKNGKVFQQIEKKGKDFFLEFRVKNEKEALALIQEKLAAGMDLAELPLLQAIYIKVANGRSLLVVQVHHLIFDILSYENFFKEWTMFYSSKKLPTLPLQYGDYTLWQREQIKKPEIQQQLDYWKTHLDGAPGLLELPWDQPRPPQFSGRGAVKTVLFPKELSTACKELAKQEGVTPFVLFFAVFNIFLYRYSGKEDLVVGTPFANRTRHELDPLIGYFLQVFAMRSKCDGNLSFSMFLQNMNETMSNAYKNSDAPLDLIVNELNPQRDPSFNPLFQVFFVFENITKSTLHFGPVKLHAFPFDTHTAKFDLTLFMVEQEEGLECRLEYCTDLFEKETIERMLSHFQTLLNSIVKNPHEKIGELQLLTSKELTEITVTWNQVGANYPKDQSVVTLFEEMAQQQPDQEALRFQGKSMSYRELNEKGNQLARHLQKLGVRNHDFVGVYLERSEELIVAALGILKAGAVFVPIDASYPMERKLYMIEDTGLKVLITKRAFVKQFPEQHLHFFCLDENNLVSYSTSNLTVKIDPLDLAYINYTSGSTGKPKGVQYPHLGLVRLLKHPTWMNIGRSDRMLQISNISFDMFAAETWGALLNGATLCIYPQIEFSPIELGRFLVDEKVTHLYLTARLFNLMVEERLDFFKNVRLFGSTGDVMSAQHAKMAFENLPSCQILNAYGPTENHITTTHSVHENTLRVPIGRPVQGTEVYVLDAHFKPVPIGVHGELYAGGDGLARGYLHDPKRTAEKFISNPFGPGKLYRTGDLVRFLPDGTLDYLGRIDTQVKILGFRIELDEVEEIIRKHPKVADCIALAKEVTSYDKYLVAYIEPKAGETVATAEMRQYVASKLPKHSLPSYFVLMEKFPLTPNGKVDRRKLPSPTAHLEQRTFEPPSTPTEQKLAKIWSHLLKIPRISRQDQFFHIGGHSILAMQLNSQARKIFNLEIPVSLIFEDSTLEKYATRIDQLRTQGTLTVSAKQPFSVWREKEAVLDPTINSSSAKPTINTQYMQPKKIFLTGATGFVGAFFLKELIEKTDAQIYCLLRAPSENQASQRIIETLETYLIWKPHYQNRIVAAAGSLEKPLLGLTPAFFHTLAAEIDSIFHIGAFVNHAMSYQQHKPANVLGTQEVLRLASTSRLKPLHFISTVAVVEGVKKTPIPEDINIEKSQEVTNGYVESKWVCEKLVLIARSRGIPCNIFRLPRVGGDSKIGSGPTGDFLWRLVQASIKLKKAPRIDLYDDLTPVNYICEAIRLISTKPEWINSQFHVASPYSLSYEDVFKFLQKLGYPLRWTDFTDWRDALVNQSLQTADARLQALASLMADTDFSKPLNQLTFATDNLKAALKGSHLKCPKIDPSLLKKYVNYYVKTGFLPDIF